MARRLAVGARKIQAQNVWNTLNARGDGSVVIMDIDTGLNYNHQDLAANVWTNPGEIAGNGIDDDHDGYVDDVHGIDTVNHDSNPIDDNGHGTHTAGTIAAVGNNALGVVGVNWNAKILPCKFLNAGGSGSDAGAAECLNYAITLKTQHGVNIRVTNNSWGGDRNGGDFSVLLNAFAAAGNAGIISFVAAGNAGRQHRHRRQRVRPSQPEQGGAEHRGRRGVGSGRQSAPDSATSGRIRWRWRRRAWAS